ncbi:MAG: MFS transporter [Planctomycetes bacterium]|nr:MFS transporter [Planctomycetota bacterium]
MSTEPQASAAEPLPGPLTPTVAAPPLELGMNIRLSIMMFLQYGIWGAWLPLFFAFLTEHRGFKGEQAGFLFGVAAIGALVAPFVAGQIADRWFNTEKFLGISHILGAVLVWQLAEVTSYAGLVIFGLLYSLIYAPTLSLTNALAFHHLPDRDRDFGRVRVWGTIGWIVVGIGMGQWLLHGHTPTGLTGTAEEIDNAIRAVRVAGMADSFKLSAMLGLALGMFCFTLPATPPQKGEQAFAALEAMAEVKKNPLLTLFLVAFPISCVHQFYFVRTEGFLGSLKMKTTLIDTIFGVGGGPMTIGQIAEIAVLAFMPILAKQLSRKLLLTVGLLAYILRFAIFAYVPDPWAVYPALGLHGLCFGCFFFVCFMIVDEETTPDVRASAQSLFNLVVVGFGVIVGNIAAGMVDRIAATDQGTDFSILFGIPMWVTVGCLLLLLIFYPGGRRQTASATA